MRYDQKCVPFCKWNVASNTWQMKIWRSKVIPNVWLIHQRIAGKVQVRISCPSARYRLQCVFNVVFKLFVALQLLWRLMLFVCPAMFIITVLLGAVTLSYVFVSPQVPEKRGGFDLMLLVDPFKGFGTNISWQETPNSSTSVINKMQLKTLTRCDSKVILPRDPGSPKLRMVINGT